jgi:hypothetical protein
MSKTTFAMKTVARRIASLVPGQQPGVRLNPARSALLISVVTVMLLSACSPSATATSQPTATSKDTATSAAPTVVPTIPLPTASPVPTEAMGNTTATSEGSAVPTSIDPCQLIPSAEASSLAGVTFGDGTEGTLSGGGRTCTYGSQTTNIFYIEVVQAADENAANAAEAQFVSDLNDNMQQITSEGITVTQIPDFADGAVTGSVNLNAGGETIGGSAFGFRKGTVFVGFSDVAVGSQALTTDVMQTEASTVLGRLP